MAQAAFGMFDWIDRGKVPINQLYAERLQLVEAADAAGFFCYHLAEHHATPLGMAPSPALFLTAAAQRTKRIRLGPLVYLLPLYHPLRLGNEDFHCLVKDGAGLGGINSEIADFIGRDATANS